jgi:hypothetical protein
MGTIPASSQCNTFYQFNEGSSWEMDNFNSKGKLSGKTKQTIKSLTGNANSFKATVNSVMFDAKGKEVMNTDLDFDCEDGTVRVDMRNFVNEDQMKAFQSYELEFQGENLEIPNNLSVGQMLNNGKMTLTASNSPIPMAMEIAITNRKVVAQESVTTPAGTFECYKITSDLSVTSKMAIKMTLDFSTVEWLAPKVAVVKSESYRKGKLQGYSVLTSTTK